MRRLRKRSAERSAAMLSLYCEICCIHSGIVMVVRRGGCNEDVGLNSNCLFDVRVRLIKVDVSIRLLSGEPCLWVGARHDIPFNMYTN